MIVSCLDTSPLNYLIQIHCEHILPAMYTSVFVPTAGLEEVDTRESLLPCAPG